MLLLLLHENISGYETSKIKSELMSSNMNMRKMYVDHEHVLAKHAGNIINLSISVCCNTGLIKRIIDDKTQYYKRKICCDEALLFWK